MGKILFLCTGNYYRSRFAELLFNHLAEQGGLEWYAISRALALERGVYNIGPISSYAIQGLHQRDIPLPSVLRMPQQLQAADLESSARIIALHEPEHRPLVEQRYPSWTQRVEYWRAPDLDQMHPDQALTYIAEQIRNLLTELTNKQNP